MSTWKIDPKTGDYVVQAGKPVPSDELIYPAYYRLRITRGRWLHAPDANYGSDFGNLKQKFNLRDGTALSNIGSRALQPMVDDGRAIAVAVSADAAQPALRNNAALTAVITSAEGTTNQLNLPPVGD